MKQRKITGKTSVLQWRGGGDKVVNTTDWWNWNRSWLLNKSDSPNRREFCGDSLPFLTLMLVTLLRSTAEFHLVRFYCAEQASRALPHSPITKNKDCSNGFLWVCGLDRDRRGITFSSLHKEEQRRPKTSCVEAQRISGCAVFPEPWVSVRV